MIGVAISLLCDSDDEGGSAGDGRGAGRVRGGELLKRGKGDVEIGRRALLRPRRRLEERALDGRVERSGDTGRTGSLVVRRLMPAWWRLRCPDPRRDPGGPGHCVVPGDHLGERGDQHGELQQRQQSGGGAASNEP